VRVLGWVVCGARRGYFSWAVNAPYIHVPSIFICRYYEIEGLFGTNR
jgi:hypothetical protein